MPDKSICFRYGYYDQEGQLRIVNYSADPHTGYHVDIEGEHGPGPGQGQGGRGGIWIYNSLTTTQYICNKFKKSFKRFSLIRPNLRNNFKKRDNYKDHKITRTRGEN